MRVARAGASDRKVWSAGWGTEDLQDPIGGVPGVRLVLTGSNGITGHRRNGRKQNHCRSFGDLSDTTGALSSWFLTLRTGMTFRLATHLAGRGITAALGWLIIRRQTDLAFDFQAKTLFSEDRCYWHQEACQGKTDQQPICTFICHFRVHCIISTLLYAAFHQDVREK